MGTRHLDSLFIASPLNFALNPFLSLDDNFSPSLCKYPPIFLAPSALLMPRNSSLNSTFPPFSLLCIYKICSSTSTISSIKDFTNLLSPLILLLLTISPCISSTCFENSSLTFILRVIFLLLTNPFEDHSSLLDLFLGFDLIFTTSKFLLLFLLYLYRLLYLHLTPLHLLLTPLPLPLHLTLTPLLLTPLLLHLLPRLPLLLTRPPPQTLPPIMTTTRLN